MTNLKQKRFVDTDYLKEQLDSTSVEVEGSNISATETKIGYTTDIEILGNTIQDASNLADIRSVGEKVEGQELYEIPIVSTGRNLVDAYTNLGEAMFFTSNGGLLENSAWRYTIDYFRVEPNREIAIGETSTNYRQYQVSFYDVNYKWIETRDITPHIISTITPQNAYYMRFSYSVHVSGSPVERVGLQVEYGSITTPYEEYKEDKLTILSPTPLEKVGDVADRIIEKDGVWGVEKNIVDFTLIGNEDWLITDLGTTLRGGYNPNLNLGGIEAISNRFVYESGYEVDKEHFYISNNAIWIFINKSLLSSATNNGIKEYLTKNNVLIKYPTTTQPTFIPLPHDQQVKLRTFANKTNISFLTEIEGYIKAQVPKSLGATVNTHTEQISNLNKELDRVKKLEESTVSTVTTESDFTTVEATSNGYFEDVKLEGKTLVNLPRRQVSYYPSGSNGAIIVSDSNVVCYEYEIKPNTTYTIKKDEVSDRGTVALFSSNSVGSVATKTVTSMISDGKISTIRTGNEDKYMLLYVNSTLISSGVKTTVLEGDHTQNPPSYFEGLKSVGQSASEDGVDEIVVSSVKGDGNLVSFESKKFNCSSTSMWYDVQGVSNMYSDMSKKTQCQVYLPTGTYTISYDGVNSTNVGTFQLVSIDDKVVINATSNENFKNTKTLNEGVYTVRVKGASVGDIFVKDAQILKGTTPKPYTPHQSDKKRLLYYNEETQTWEKPILRQWDSIEKHADGKYYYHQRSEEVVLNGSESSWVQGNLNGVALFSIDIGSHTGSLAQPHICDKFKDTQNYALLETTEYGIYSNSTRLYFRPSFNISDLDSFKQWLQANNVTVVYQLAEEKVYECTNIDLITYTNETNYIVESGAISPRTTLKVHNNISNVVSLLQKKVSLLEAELYNYKVNQNLRQLRTFYKSDYANFGVATLNNYSVEPTSIAITPYGYDLFEIFKEVIAQGKDKYDRIELEEYIDFYLMTFVFDFDMVFELFDLLDANEDIIEDEPVEEEPPTEEEEDVVEDTPTILPNLPGDEATPIPLI